MGGKTWTIRVLAEADIDEIADYIGAHNRSAAKRFIVAVRKDFDFLVGFPGAGSVRETVSERLPGLRSWRVGGFKNYLIFYRPTPDGIEVHRVLHGARDVDRELTAGG